MNPRPGRGGFAAPLLLGFALSLALAASSGCRRDPTGPPRNPEAAARAVFALAGAREVPDTELRALFREDLVDRHFPALGDTLERLPRTEPEILAVHELSATGRTAVDLRLTSPGGGESSFTVHTEPRPGGSWCVVWLAGPGTSWPPAAHRKGENLSHNPPL